MEPVSYTHLDVYKRQQVDFLQRVPTVYSTSLYYSSKLVTVDFLEFPLLNNLKMIFFCSINIVVLNYRLVYKSLLCHRNSLPSSTMQMKKKQNMDIDKVVNDSSPLMSAIFGSCEWNLF